MDSDNDRNRKPRSAGGSKARLAAGLDKKLSANPDQSADVIIRVQGSLDARQKLLEARGLRIRRRLSLVNGFAVTAPGAQIAALAEEPWVTSIEQDSQVHTL